MEKGIQNGAGRLFRQRHGIGGLDLVQNLALADDEGIQPGHHFKQMSDAGFPFIVEEILFLRFAISGKGKEEGFQRLLCTFILQDRIDFRAVAGGKHHRFLDALLLLQVMEPALRAFRRNGELLSYIYRDCFMIQP